MADWAAVVVSLLAFVVAVGSFVVAYVTERRSRMPVLQFVWLHEQGVWALDNVGSGPALNPIVAEADRTALTTSVKEVWQRPILIPSIAAGGRAILPWATTTGALGASYTDATRFFYTTKCGGDVSIFFVGLHLPRWPLGSHGGRFPVERWWGIGDKVRSGVWSQVGPAEASRPRWPPRYWLLSRFGVARRMRGWADPVGTYRERPRS
jgi:hypothetical protein